MYSANQNSLNFEIIFERFALKISTLRVEPSTYWLRASHSIVQLSFFMPAFFCKLFFFKEKLPD